MLIINSYWEGSDTVEWTMCIDVVALLT